MARKRFPHSLTIAVIAKEDIAEIIHMFLALEGFRTLVALSGQVGLEMIQANIPDVLILDELTPEIDGHKLYNIIVNDPELKQIPIVFLKSGQIPRDWPILKPEKNILLRAPIGTKKLLEAIEWVCNE